MSDLTNAVERIGRAGSENSRATEKLLEACRKLANYISDEVVHFCAEIPQSDGMEKYRVQLDSRNFRYLAMEVKGDEGYYEPFYKISEEWRREDCLAFSRDVSNGLLDHIAGWLESRALESDSAAIVVESVITAQS